MSAGKGDKPRPVDMDKAVIYCEHNRFRDRCDKCSGSPIFDNQVKKCECGGLIQNYCIFTYPPKFYLECQTCKKKIENK